MPGEDLCLLSLDGGGVRGLSSLHILRELMRKIEPNRRLKPCEYFDMIGGTSTGGLMAIMLGRLRMDIDECIDAYIKLSDRIFTRKKPRLTITGKIQGRFDTKELEEGIKEIVRDKTGSVDTLFRDHPKAPCKVFVCATRRDATATTQFTSYESRSNFDLLETTKIWEAARATSAAPSFFDSIKIGKCHEEFGDGGTGANNPVRILWNQAQYCLKQGGLVEKNLKCLISIGTGIPSLKPFGDQLLKVAKTLQNIATETEITAKSFREEHAELAKQNRYFRFNVSRGLEKIGLEDATQRPAIMAATRVYVEDPEVAERMQLCGKNVKEARQKSTFNVAFLLKGIPVVNNFVPRDDDLKKLEDALLPRPASQPQRQVFVLHGFGGIGKTQLAVRFARKCQKRFSAIFWLNGSTKNQIQQDLAGVASRLSDEVPEARSFFPAESGADIKLIVKGLLRWLSQPGNGRWLLILDNVDRDSSAELKDKDPDAFDLAEYLPPADHGSILITTRLSKLRQLETGSRGFQLLQVNEEQALQILNSCLDSPPKGLIEIVRRLGGIPLALHHAGSYLRQTGCTVSEYLEAYNKQWDELVCHDKTSATYKSIKSAWTLSYRYVKQKNERAAKLLLLWAHLENANVSYQLLAPSATMYEQLIPNWFRACVKDNLAFLNTIKTLMDHSLVEATVGSRSYSMHPLLHNWCYHFCSKGQAEFAWLASLTLGAAGHASSRDLAKGATISSVKLLLPHYDRLLGQTDDGLADRLNGDAMVKAYCASLTMGAGYNILHNQLEKFERFTLHAHNAAKRLPNSYSVLKAAMARNLCLAYISSGKPNQAEELILQNLRGKSWPVSCDPDVLHIFCALVELFMNQKRWEKAEEILKQILEASMKDSNHLHQFTWQAYDMLGKLYDLTDDLPKAKVAYSRAVEEKKKHGAGRACVAISVSALGNVFAAMNDLTEAEQMDRSSLSEATTLWGANHSMTLAAVFRLACTCKDLKRFGEAETLLLRAKNGYMDWYGPSGEDTLRAARHLRDVSTMRAESARANPCSHAI